MKTYSNRTNDIMQKANVLRYKRKKAIQRTVSAVCAACLVLGLILFVPYNHEPPSTEKYQASEYYDVINKLNLLSYQKPDYDNNWDRVVSFLDDLWYVGKGGAMEDTNGGWPESDRVDMEDFVDEALPEGEPGDINSESSSESYEETTDNQVSGVIEGDRIKRSNKYIYYLLDTTLYVYSIEKEESKLVGMHALEDSMYLENYCGDFEMYLSKDCSTITLVTSCYTKGQRQVCLISIDVSDPTHMKETNRTYLSGEYLSSRLVGDELLVMSRYQVFFNDHVDYDNPETFVPSYGTKENPQCINPENIVSPDTLSHSQYTVLCKLDMKTLEAKDTAAFLSYSNEVYVSETTIYASRQFDVVTTTSDDQGVNYEVHTTTTEISAMDYTGDTFRPAGSVVINGYLNNQYYMDEYEGILRVVTTNDSYCVRKSNDGLNASVDPNASVSSDDATSSDVNFYDQFADNASLYCIDINTWEIVASVERFAPAGETVQSVRFDKDKAYVCTAIIITFTDPVFMFDLSDLDNITYKDTGDIVGYSSSLVNFGDNYLLGIGYGADRDTLKLEIYTEGTSSVDSVCSYEVPYCYFATEYKAYYINRDEHLIGLAYYDYNESNPDYFTHYILLLFDGYDFIKILDVDLGGSGTLNHVQSVNYFRATLIDGYFYMMGENFVVEPLSME